MLDLSHHKGKMFIITSQMVHKGSKKQLIPPLTPRILCHLRKPIFSESVFYLCSNRQLYTCSLSMILLKTLKPRKGHNFSEITQLARSWVENRTLVLRLPVPSLVRWWLSCFLRVFCPQVNCKLNQGGMGWQEQPMCSPLHFSQHLAQIWASGPGYLLNVCLLLLTPLWNKLQYK